MRLHRRRAPERESDEDVQSVQLSGVVLDNAGNIIGGGSGYSYGTLPPSARMFFNRRGHAAHSGEQDSDRTRVGRAHLSALTTSSASVTCSPHRQATPRCEPRHAATRSTGYAEAHVEESLGDATSMSRSLGEVASADRWARPTRVRSLSCSLESGACPWRFEEHAGRLGAASRSCSRSHRR